MHEQGAAAIESVYKGAAGTLDWAKTRLMVAPGVVVSEGMLTADDGGTVSFPFMSLLAVDGNKVAHEEVFLDPGPDTKKAVTFAGSAPGPKDTAKAASQVATAVGDAFAAGDQAALRELLAPGVRFYDTELRTACVALTQCSPGRAAPPRSSSRTRSRWPAQAGRRRAGRFARSTPPASRWPCRA